MTIIIGQLKVGMSWCNTNSVLVTITSQLKVRNKLVQRKLIPTPNNWYCKVIGRNELVQCQLAIVSTTGVGHAKSVLPVGVGNNSRCSLLTVGAQHIDLLLFQISILFPIKAVLHTSTGDKWLAVNQWQLLVYGVAYIWLGHLKTIWSCFKLNFQIQISNVVWC